MFKDHNFVANHSKKSAENYNYYDVTLCPRSILLALELSPTDLAETMASWYMSILSVISATMSPLDGGGAGGTEVLAGGS